MTDWTEKYRPTTLAEVRGNDAAVEALREWAEQWGDHREAALLYGAPGVGKTSAAHALANDAGWEVIELNASDQRTAGVIERIAGEAARSGTLAGGGGGRKLVLLDEADNLHGNYDRGGTAALTRLAKASSQPIVLIANDLYEVSRGLRGACREIEFRDVSARSILPVLRDICRREDVDPEDGALEAIAEANDGDLRGAINDLQAVAVPGQRLAVDDIVSSDRDRTEGIFPYLDDLLQTAGAEEALRASYRVDETPDDLLAWIDENVPKEFEGDELAGAYRALAAADRWLGRVRATQNYTYWRYARDAMTAGVAAARTEPKRGWTRYGPPSYWRRLGSSRGARARRDDIAREVADISGMSLATARREVLPVLAAMTHHCSNRELTVQMAAAYGLDAEGVAHLTGSGKDTNKVQEIVDDARARRAEALEAHSQGAFAGVPDEVEAAAASVDGGSTAGETDGSEPDDEPDDAAEGTDDQSGLSDFL